MGNTHDYTHLLYKNLDHNRGEEFSEDTNENTITEKELEKIHPDLDHNFPSPTMNSVLMNICNNYPENVIDDPEYFSSIIADS